MVQLSDNATDFGSPLALNGAGQASIVTADLTVGAHPITAAYAPSGGSYNPSSGSVSQTLQPPGRPWSTTARCRATSTIRPSSPPLTRQYDASPIAGKLVHLAVPSQSCDAVTSAAGHASCTVTPQGPAGTYTVKAAFAGDAGSQPSSYAKAFTVTREQTSLRYTGDTVIAIPTASKVSPPHPAPHRPAVPASLQTRAIVDPRPVPFRVTWERS